MLKPVSNDYTDKKQFGRDYSHWYYGLHREKRIVDERLKRHQSHQPMLYLCTYVDIEGRKVIKVGQTILPFATKQHCLRQQYSSNMKIVAQWILPQTSSKEYRLHLETCILSYLEEEGFERFVRSWGGLPTERFYLGDEDIDTLIVNLNAFILSKDK